jgi:hypothetical protein
MFWKAISKLFGLVLLAVVLGVIALGGYFWYKSGQPMQVEEAQRMAPGITFREFREDRIRQWNKWDEELRAVGKNGACASSESYFWITGITIGFKDTLYMRSIRDDLAALRKFRVANNGIIIPDKYLNGSWLTFPDAYWWYVENSFWYQYSHDPGFPVKALNQRRACSTTYPTQKAESKLSKLISKKHACAFE